MKAFVIYWCPWHSHTFLRRRQHFYSQNSVRRICFIYIFLPQTETYLHSMSCWYFLFCFKLKKKIEKKLSLISMTSFHLACALNKISGQAQKHSLPLPKLTARNKAWRVCLSVTAANKNRSQIGEISVIQGSSQVQAGGYRRFGSGFRWQEIKRKKTKRQRARRLREADRRRSGMGRLDARRTDEDSRWVGKVG